MSKSPIIARLVDDVIEREGGYVNHPADRGGPTRFGITQAVARGAGYSGDMRLLPRTTAAAIYERNYWRGPGYDQVATRSELIAAELFDTAVNMGPAVPSAFLQRALNALNRTGRDYAEIRVDGRSGPATLAALDAFLKLRGKTGEIVMLKALEALQGERYVAIAERNNSQEAFLYGWLDKRLGQALDWFRP